MNALAKCIEIRIVKEFAINYDPSMMNHFHWEQFITKLKSKLSSEKTLILYCKKVVSVPSNVMRSKIVEETTGCLHGHKGMYKKYARLLTSFFGRE